MTIERKSGAFAIKKVGAGEATVVIATLGVRDKDGDVIMPGFFGEQHVPVVGAHDWQSVPLGKAHVYEQGNEALADITFNLGTTEGKDWHAAIKFDYDHPPARQEYSFGFRVYEGAAEMGDHAGERVRFLKPLPDGRPGLDMAEVSPVLRGAGQNTRTLEVKAEEKIQATPEPSQTDAKDLNLEQLITLLDRQIDHLTFVQEVRAQHKKRLSHDTIAMIDETSKKFERLRYAVKLPPAPSPEETVALVKEAHDVQSWLDAEASERQVQQQTANAALIESFESTFDAIQETLHPVSR